MNRKILITFLLPGIYGSIFAQNQKPNIIYILADDLGYGDLGCYGQTKIETPNIDTLSTNGILFTQHYTGSPVSAPARSVLLTGKHSGKTQIRGNDEMPSRGKVWNYQAVNNDSTLEGQYPLKARTLTLGSLLQSAGYKTAIIGKWGLGAPNTDGIPNKCGFDYFYGYNCQRQAHTYYPAHLWENNHKVYLKNDIVAPHTNLPAGADSMDIKSYSLFSLNEYSPDLMMEKISAFVTQNKENPFFLLWASPIPHVPLQAPQKWIDYYVNKFGDENPYLNKNNYFPQRYPHAAYASMISHLDEQVGELIKQLKELGIYNNTLIIFSSDNGPAYNGGSDSPWFNSAFPFKNEKGFTKGSLNEGGIRIPMIVSWPEVIRRGTKSNHLSAFYDIMPTFAEIAEITIPGDADGISILPTLKGETQKQHPFLYWEFPESGGQMAVRIGKFKALRKNMHKGNLKWELYNLENDSCETKDI